MKLVTKLVTRRYAAAWFLCLVFACSKAPATISVPSGNGLIDRALDPLSLVPQYPHDAVCKGGALACKSRVRTDGSGQIQSFAQPATVAGLGPPELVAAYKLHTAMGAGASIAIVDAFGYPHAESDLATYRSHFGLPPCTTANGCLKIVNQSGQTSPLPPEPSSSDDWTVEAALDLEMASAACPNCSILYVQANDDTSDGLYLAQDTAASLGATVVSDSWGGPDDGTAPQYETHFNHPAVGYFVASGDNGNTGTAPDYPSTSAFVTAVGGTTLARSSDTSRGWIEGTWSGSGSSCSKEIPQPTFQQTHDCAFRAAADVSAVADPNTGVAVYNNGPSSSGWIVVGGTSAASPLVAGAFALSGRGAAGPSFSYKNANDFFDVTTGSNGTCIGTLCNAGFGWDGPTGNGTPDGAAMDNRSCSPTCAGKRCGDDGCGGSCGACTSGQTCDPGTRACIDPPPLDLSAYNAAYNGPENHVVQNGFATLTTTPNGAQTGFFGDQTAGQTVAMLSSVHGLRVIFDGAADPPKLALLSYASNVQLNFIVPSWVAGGGSTPTSHTVEVRRCTPETAFDIGSGRCSGKDTVTSRGSVPVFAFGPALFTDGFDATHSKNYFGKGYPSGWVDGDYATRLSARDGLQGGDTLELYGTGFRSVDVINGQIIGGAGIVLDVMAFGSAACDTRRGGPNPCEVELDTLYAGPAGGWEQLGGLDQLNLRMPTDDALLQLLPRNVDLPLRVWMRYTSPTGEDVGLFANERINKDHQWYFEHFLRVRVK